MQKNESKFLIAAKTNDFINLSKLLLKSDKARTQRKMKGFLDIDVRNSEGASAIHYAASHGNIEMMEELISRGTLIDSVDKIGWRPLSYASAHRQVLAAKKLIDCGSKVNITNENNSPMHIASALGHKDIVKILMENGADIHSQNQRHQTPVDVACENNHYGVVNILLSGSSNQIEEFSKNSFKTATKRSLHSPVVKTSTLPMAMSSNNIAYMSLSKSPSLVYTSQNLELFKKCDTGSQEEIYSLGHYKTKPFNSNSTKKSESLNELCIEDMKDKEILHNQCTENIQISPKRNEWQGDLEIVLPYPTKFSTSEVLKLKSPLLPFKSNWIKTQGFLNKETPKISMLRTKSNEDSNPHNKSFNISKENGEGDVSLQNVKTNYKSQRITNEIVRSSLILQPHYDMIPRSPHQTLSQEVFLNQPKVNGKPPTSKHKVKSNSHVNTENTRTVNSYQKKPHKRTVFENSVINSSYISSTSHKEYVKSPCSSELINSSCVNNGDISCHRWIQSIGLSMIWDTLENEGFDGFLALSSATDIELLTLCNNRSDYKNILKEQLNNLSIPSMDQLVFSLDIQQTLIQLGLEEYSSNFTQEGYFFMNNLPNISEKLMNQLGIIKIGHRRVLLKCFTVQLLRESSVVNTQRNNRNVSDIPCQVSTDSSISMYFPYTPYFSENETMNECNLSPSSYSNKVAMSKRLPPPIPPRSCSILNENSTENITVENTLIESMFQENISPKKKDYCASKEVVADLTKLDDIMNMLSDLGRELDFELKLKE